MLKTILHPNYHLGMKMAFRRLLFHQKSNYMKVGFELQFYVCLFMSVIAWKIIKHNNPISWNSTALLDHLDRANSLNLDYYVGLFCTLYFHLSTSTLMILTTSLHSWHECYRLLSFGWPLKPDAWPSPRPKLRDVAISQEIKDKKPGSVKCWKRLGYLFKTPRLLRK